MPAGSPHRDPPELADMICCAVLPRSGEAAAVRPSGSPRSVARAHSACVCARVLLALVSRLRARAHPGALAEFFLCIIII